jgi:outer membrane protein assembly factor BamE (lipoprotein component of BamABCDE complex)
MRGKMKTPMIFFFLITLAFSANAQEATIEQLNQKIEQLENRVSILESIIANSNKKKSKQANVTAVAPKLQSWRKLKKNMTFDDVIDILGEPLRINSGGFTYWYYSKDISHSYVSFVRDLVYGWKEPE